MHIDYVRQGGRNNVDSIGWNTHKEIDKEATIKTEHQIIKTMAVDSVHDVHNYYIMTQCSYMYGLVVPIP